MAVRAEMETKITGTEAGIHSLDELREAFKRLGNEGQTAAAKLSSYKKLIDDPKGAKGWTTNQRFAAEAVKLGAKIIGDQITSAASAIAAPAKTTYDQAINKAYHYRDANQKIALSVGKSYEATGQQIMGTAQRLGMMPGRVMAYGQSVRSLTGDWAGAMSGMDAAQNRALKTGRTIEEMIPATATLATTFGIKNTEDMNKFFGTLDKQAKNAGVSAEIAEKAFMSMAGMMASITNAKPATISAFTTSMIAGAPTAALGEERAAGIASFIDQHTRWIEGKGQKSGILKKGERLRDKQGLIRGEKFADAIQILQQEAAALYGTKNKEELVGRMEETGTMPARIGAGLMNANPDEIRKLAKVSGTADDLLTIQNASAAGKRNQSEVRKDIKDIGLGDTMLGVQDRAVSMGGGASGVLIANAGQLFSDGSKTFWDAVNIFAGAKAVKTAAAAGEASIPAAELASGAAKGAGRVGLRFLAAPLALAEVLTWSGQENNAPRQKQMKLEYLEKHSASLNKIGMSGMIANLIGPSPEETKAQIASLKAELQGGGIDSAAASMMAKANAKELAPVLAQYMSADKQPSGQAPLE